MRIYCVGYRSWALNIYKILKKKTNHQFKIQDKKKNFCKKNKKI